MSQKTATYRTAGDEPTGDGEMLVKSGTLQWTVDFPAWCQEMCNNPANVEHIGPGGVMALKVMLTKLDAIARYAAMKTDWYLLDLCHDMGMIEYDAGLLEKKDARAKVLGLTR